MDIVDVYNIDGKNWSMSENLLYVRNLDFCGNFVDAIEFMKIYAKNNMHLNVEFKESSVEPSDSFNDEELEYSKMILNKNTGSRVWRSCRITIE